MLWDIIEYIRFFLKENLFCRHKYTTKIVNTAYQSFEVKHCDKCGRVRVNEL